MAYVPVPKDLTKIKTKVAFNLTKRQLVLLRRRGAHRRAAVLFAQRACGDQHGGHVHDGRNAAFLSVCHV